MNVQILDIGNEQNKVICIDNFFSDPNRLVDVAAKSLFAPYAAATQRKGYPGVRTAAPADYSLSLVNSVNELVRREFSIASPASIKLLQEAMCLMTVPESALGPLQTIPHFDASNPHFFATLLYLCDEAHGGTGFYRHNATGYETITPERCDHYLDVCYEELNTKRREKRYFADTDAAFTKTGFVPAKFNRLVIYQGCILHSANILSDISLQADPRKGRLTANVFFSF
ncbi:DUF6445 family protein [Cellvibrio fontiphilus]|jgi:hypothetical protein|uniref:DUF6445 family protein n=1 Tax=Cellvibrio fontiphilus TaxID=1815559 RepID=A0ABV7FJE7_9GAMM